jgi:ribosome-associated protein
LEQLSLLTNSASKSGVKLSRNSKYFKTIISAIQDKKGTEIISLDLRKIPESIADFFIICEASSTTQVKAIADYIEYQVKEVIGENPYRHEGKTSGLWVLIDYVDIVIHVMHPEARQFYDLEDMWSDALTQSHPY